MLVGRDAERARIGALLEAAHASRSGALVLRGEPGVGKTALLEDARAQAADMHLVSARGVESESDLPFAGLHQLVRPALSLLDRLPRPQAAALEGAFGIAERSGDDRFLISVACLSLLSELADDRPVLCLVDDVQWLDSPSSDALLFVARRLGAEGIVILLAAREIGSGSFEARDVPSLELGGLDSTAAASLVTERVGESLAPSVRDVLVERAAGNALTLVELASVLTRGQLAGEEPLPDALPLTRDLERLFLERVRELPDDTQQALLIVAADDSGQRETVVRAAETLGLDAESLSAAEHARIVSVTGSMIEVRHPLVRSAVYQAASSSERRAVHLALADALSDELDVDRRAWHRASAAHGRDAAVADELERAAQRARLRSGHAAAATALERAARLSVDGESRARRLVSAASAAWDAGQPDRALTLLEETGPVAETEVRAQVLHVRGEIQFRCGDLLEGYGTLMEGASTIAELDSGKALDMLFDAANAAITAGDYARVQQAARAATELPRDDEREMLLVELLIGVGGSQHGHIPHELPRVLDAIERVEEFNEPRWLVWASGAAQIVGDRARAAAFLRRALALARASAQRERLAPALASFVLDGLIESRFAVAAEAEEGIELTRHAGLRNLTSVFLASLAWFASVRGEDDECRAYAAEATAAARATGAAVAGAIAEWALALLDLTAGLPGGAAARLEAVRTGASGVRHPYIALLSTPDLVEACVRVGRRDHALAAYGVLERFAHPEAPAWARALEQRCKALQYTDGDAETSFIEALRLHEEADRPFDQARTALLYGEFLRRERRRTDAREQLRAALGGFERLGAEAWASRARAELRASGETARKRDPSTVHQLTPQELQIVRFVAEGLSNKEVAAQLFLSPRTIDYHLRNVFKKLGITSRTQLAGIALREHEVVAKVQA